ncbi:hypothetical protein ALT721_800087 [Alteromonas alvinellae]
MHKCIKTLPSNYLRNAEPIRIYTSARPKGSLRSAVVLACKQCGQEFIRTRIQAIRTQQATCSASCRGKYKAAQSYGGESNPLYSRWLSMTQRVTNPNSTNYQNYGGRGIEIRDGLNDFKTYVEYVSSLPGYDESKLSNSFQLDRIDNDGHYEIGNLRWVDQSINVANQRHTSKKTSNKYTGVNWSKTHNKWVARITLKGKQLLSSTHDSEESALIARNQFIKDNNLPHQIQPISK